MQDPAPMARSSRRRSCPNTMMKEDLQQHNARGTRCQLGFWGGHVLGSASDTHAVRHGMRSSTRAERWAMGAVMWLEEGVRSAPVERIGKKAYFLKWQLLAALEALHSSDLSLMMSSNTAFEACSLYLASHGKMILFSLARSLSRKPTNVRVLVFF